MVSFPFFIRRLSLDNAGIQVRTQMIKQPMQDSNTNFPAYIVTSSDPINIEDAWETVSSAEGYNIRNTKAGIRDIANHLYKMADESDEGNAELIIAVHGYGSGERAVRAWYSDIFKLIARDDPAIRTKRNCVFIGYRWPCGNGISLDIKVNFRNLIQLIRALPSLVKRLIIIWIGIVALLTLLQLLQLTMTHSFLSVGLFQTLALMYFSLILLVLIALLGAYFQDSYRAENSGVRDLVELLRHIDRELSYITKNTTTDRFLPLDTSRSDQIFSNDRERVLLSQNNKRIKLSFITGV